VLEHVQDVVAEIGKQCQPANLEPILRPWVTTPAL
jgi:hypothetical protein